MSRNLSSATVVIGALRVMSESRVRFASLNMLKPSSGFCIRQFQGGASFGGPFLLFMFHVCLIHTVWSCGQLLRKD